MKDVQCIFINIHEMLLVFSAEEVTVAFLSQVSTVCARVRETEGKGMGKGKRELFCVHL